MASLSEDERRDLEVALKEARIILASRYSSGLSRRLARAVMKLARFLSL